MTTANRAMNSPSRLLQADENNTLFSLLEPRSVAQKSAVVRLYFGVNGSWQKQCCGVACYIKDSMKRSYFIRIYDIVNESRLWEQEIFSGFTYDTPKPFLHIFFSDKCTAALSFADEIEAEEFASCITKTLDSRKERKERNQQAKTAQSPSPSSAPIILNSEPTNLGSQSNAKANKKQAGKNAKKKKLNKTDIGVPTDFRHVEHVGYDKNQGSIQSTDSNNQVADPDEMVKFKKYLAHIGKSNVMKPEDTDFMLQFIRQTGGIDKYLAEIEGKPNYAASKPITNSGRSNTPLPPPPPPAQSHSRPVPPPPPPPQGRPVGSMPPPPPPPPGPPSGRAPPPPPPMSRGPNRGAAPPPPPPPFGGPAPPPPPPPPSGGPAPPPPPPPPPVGGAPPPPPPVSGGGAPPPPPPAPPVSDSRGDLLSQIQGFSKIKLTKVTENERTSRPAVADEADAGGEASLTNALFAAMNKRNLAMHRDSSDDEDGDSDEDEWDED